MILLVAHRYGVVPVGESKSIVHLEYEMAVAHSIPVLAFFLDPTFPWPPDFVDIEHDKTRLLSAF
jgi:hypothetical protein